LVEQELRRGAVDPDHRDAWSLQRPRPPWLAPFPFAAARGGRRTCDVGVRCGTVQAAATEHGRSATHASRARTGSRGPRGRLFGTMLKVSGLSIAPVKALALTHPNQVRVEPFGIAENRRFYLVDADGSRVSGPKHGRLMQVRSAYDDSVERLRLTFPDGTGVEYDASGVNGSAVASEF